jgi:MATE family multidrug resistance protein
MKNRITNKEYLSLAIPFILSTVTQPLLGAVDISIVGQLKRAEYIAGVSVGTVIFNTMYWLFGFLRVETTALSAQAGKGKEEQQAAAILRPLILALSIGFFMLVLQKPLYSASMYLLKPEQDVIIQIERYYNILIWGAPLVLSNYVMLGWLMGQSKVKASLFMQISGNLINIVLDLFFVHKMEMAVSGVATAAFLAQLYTCIVGCICILRYKNFKLAVCRRILKSSTLSELFRFNSDLMLRTGCLLIQTNLFTAVSASLGTPILSANAILLQIQSVISYMFDGIANASSVYAGRAVGQKDEGIMRSAWKMTAKWTTGLAVLLTTVYLAGYERIIPLFTNLPDILALALRYAGWVALYPFLAGLGLAFYGVFTGSGNTKPVRNSTAISLIIFIAISKLLVPLWGNHGIWAALLLFYFGRTIFLLPSLKQTMKKTGKEVKKIG